MASNNTSRDDQNGSTWKHTSSSVENVDSDVDNREEDDSDEHEHPDAMRVSGSGYYNRQQSEPVSADRRSTNEDLNATYQMPRVRPTRNTTSRKLIDNVEFECPSHLRRRQRIVIRNEFP